MIPDIVMAVGLMILFSAANISKGYLTMLLAHICFCTPYVIISVYPKVRELDVNIANAAMDLGATPWQALWKVIIPMIKPGIYAGVLLAFTMSIDDFVVSYFVSGNGVKNISIVVYNMTKRTNPTMNALSTLLIGAIILITVIVNLAPKFKKTRFSKHLGKIAGILGIILLISVLLFSYNSANLQNTLKVYNAGEYIEESLIEKFEEETGCKVIYETFDSNESMYTKINSGEKYDIIIPSDYMIERLIKEERVREIDWERLSNAHNLMESVLNKEYDPNNKYSVPYFWGSVGILYDKTKVDKADLKDGWELLRNPKYKGNLYMYDSERDSFMVAMKALGFSLNTEKPEEIDKAYEWLLEQNRTMSPVYAGDDVIDNMISGNKALAVVYSGDAAYIITENPNLEYFEPHQGTNLWYDGMVITKNCKDTELAHKFIDFFLDEENALINTQAVGYSSCIASVYEEMQKTDYEGVSAYTPRLMGKDDEVFRYQSQKTKEYCATLWTKIKAEGVR
ncbi:MAG: extracellular solute-binding protein, partial [Clostridia bacterium]|nr:extracellular solute-binding protein [Clostridia bacterium]